MNKKDFKTFLQHYRDIENQIERIIKLYKELNILYKKGYLDSWKLDDLHQDIFNIKYVVGDGFIDTETVTIETRYLFMTNDEIRKDIEEINRKEEEERKKTRVIENEKRIAREKKWKKIREDKEKLYAIEESK